MTDGRNGALAGVRRLLIASGVAELTDGQLLELFVADRDGAAFEALVRRHGPMVLGVCRRTARHEQDAEDAFQATFLVLARRAADVRPADRVGYWLYGVASRTARKAWANARRREARERPIDGVPEPAAGPAKGNELAQALDAELGRLPDLYRVPLVLCDLEDRPRKDVARQLGIPEGTLSSRLTTARQRLADRLARRGVTVAAATIGTAVGGGAIAVPPALLAATARLGAAGGPVATPVAALAGAAVRATAVGRLAVAVAAIVAAAGGVVALSGGPGPPPGPATYADPPGPTPVAASPAAGLRAHLERAEWVLTAVAAGGRAVDVSDRPAGVDALAILDAPNGLTPSGLTLRNLAVEPGAAVAVDGRAATPADLRPGMRARLRLAPGRLAVTGAEARSSHPPPHRYVIAAVDPARGTLVVTVPGTGVRIDGLVLTPDTRVEVFRFEGKDPAVRVRPGSFADLRAGATADLDFGVDDAGGVVVRRVRTAE